ncbi:hypothetical protein ACFYZE_31180 [Streptomyces sp. NPDC001796]|uniref:hypothetical protein n=1 Tax=Streptomyces sp. NPDC001796 TaxID=3364609 RepID=UPI0036A43E2F
MEDVSSTVTATPVAVDMVKPDVDVVSTMPVAPPVAGPDRAPPPEPAGLVGAAVGEDVAGVERDDEEAAASDVQPTVSPARAHVSPAVTIHPPFFRSNRRALDIGAWTGVLAAADSGDEWPVTS